VPLGHKDCMEVFVQLGIHLFLISKIFSCCAGLLLEGRIRGLKDVVRVINCYAPFSRRHGFWDRIQQSGVLSDPGLIFCGDLNFIVASNEIWGSQARKDGLVGYFCQMLNEFRLIDMIPGKLSPTWRNGRRESGGIGKRLDRFLVVEDLAGKMDRF
jgi:hypothetical protein